MQSKTAEPGFPYTIRSSARARYVRVTVEPTGEVVVTKPLRVSERAAKKFLAERATWVERHVRRAQGKVFLPRKPKRAYLAGKERARAFIRERLAHFNQLYDYSIGRVAIRDPKRRWGSCSKGGNLSFSWRLLDLPPALADYVVVHELCHIREFNHSPAFWALVARAIPDYRARRKQLRNIIVL